MQSFFWNRRKLTANDYAKNMEIPQDTHGKQEFSVSVKGDGKNYSVLIGQDLLDALHGSKNLSAYETASDIRKFEIGLFWQRAGFFWAFIAAIYAAYYSVLKDFYTDKCGNQEHGGLPLLILSMLGLFFCVSWLLSSKGSKHWQENWEDHLDLLEDEVTGPLYKTYRTKSYSESKITIAAGWVVSACAYGLMLYEFASMVSGRLGEKCIVWAAAVLSFAIISVLCLFAYSRLMLGNISDSGEISFQLKSYEGNTYD